MSTDQHLADTIVKVREHHRLRPSPDGLCGDVTNLSHKLDLVQRGRRHLAPMVISPGQRMTLDLPEEFVGLTGDITLSYREMVEVGGERVELVRPVAVYFTISFETESR